MGESFYLSLNVALAATLDALVLLAVVFIGRLFYKFTTGVKLEEEITVRDNVAMGVASAGFLIGLGIAASGALISIGDAVSRPLMIGAVGLVSMVLLRISLLINDKLILSKFNNLEEIIRDKNLGVAFVEAGSCIATGLMIHGVMTGQAASVQDKLIYGGIYWAIGQTILVVAAFLFRPLCGFNVDHVLQEDNNAAAGLAFGGYLVAMGLIVQSALDRASTNIASEIATIAVFTAIGFALMLVARFGLERIILPSASMPLEINRDKNMGAASLSAIGYLIVAIVFAASIAPATTSAAFARDFADDSEIQPPVVIQAAEAKPQTPPSAANVAPAPAESQQAPAAK